MPKIKPRGLQFWVDQCIKFKPTLSTTVYCQGLEFLNNTQTSYQKLSEYFYQDPILVYYLFKYAKISISAPTTPIKDLEHVLSILGRDQIHKILKKAPRQTTNPKNIAHQQYLRANAICFHGAWQAQNQAQQSTNLEAGESYLASLLLGIPFCLLWFGAVPEMRMIEQMVLKNRISWANAQKNILGCTWEQITKHMAGLKDFPLLTQYALAEEHRPSTKDLAISLSHSNYQSRESASPLSTTSRPNNETQVRRTSNSRALKIAISQYLSFHSNYDWNSRHTSKAIRLLSTIYQKSIDQTQAWVHQVSAQAAQRFEWAGSSNSACLLLQDNQPAFRRSAPIITIAPPIPTKSAVKKASTLSSSPEEEPTEKPDPQPINEQPVEAEKPEKEEEKNETVVEEMPTLTTMLKLEEVSLPSPGRRRQGNVDHIAEKHKLNSNIRTRDLEYLNKLQNKMANHPDRFKSLHDLMNSLVAGVCTGIGLPRALGGLLNQEGSKIMFYYGKGLTPEQPLVNYEAPLGTGLLFDQLISKPAALWITPDNIKKIKPLIPTDFFEAIEVEDFFLISLFVNKKPFAVIYADRYQSETSLEPQEFKSFKHLCNAGIQGLIHFAKQSRQQKKKNLDNPFLD